MNTSEIISTYVSISTFKKTHNRLHYKDQSVNEVYENNVYSEEKLNMQIRIANKLLGLEQAVNMVTTRL